MIFTSPVPPSVNNYLGKRVAYKGKVPYVHVYKTNEAKKFDSYLQKVIKRAITKHGWETPKDDEYIEAHYTLYLERKRKDADNYFKLLNDALTHCGAIIDDDCIIPIVDNIYIDKDNPRIEVSLKKSDKVGIFTNKQEFDCFVESNCSECSRYKRNCSILREAKENRLTPKINLEALQCESKKLSKGK